MPEALEVVDSGTGADEGMMRSIVQDRYTSEPDRAFRIAEVAVPTPARDEVLVRLHASSIDRGTWHLMAGLPYPVRLAGFGARRPNFGNPGLNLAGTVVAVGAEVVGFDPGDRVFGIGEATFAEFAIAPSRKLALTPPVLTSVEAAVLPVSGLTALQAVRDHAKVTAGERVLVLGAAGGVGSLVTQLATAAGALVTSVASAEKVDRLRAHGFESVVAYEHGDPSGPFDVIIDTGGNRSIRTLRRLLTSTGRLVIVGGENGGRWLGGLDRQLRAQVLSRFIRQSLGAFISNQNAADLGELGAFYTAGDVRPLVDSVFPLEEAAAAVTRLVDGRAIGKIALTID